MAYASARKYDEAIADFTKAIELDPEHEDAYRQRAYIYYHYTEQYRAALADYTRVNELDPSASNDSVGIVIWNILQDEGKDVGFFTDAIKRDPAQASTYYNRGVAYEYLGQWKTAIANFTKAIDLHPEYAAAYYHRGVIYAEHFDQPEKALVDLSKAIELVPDEPTAYIDRGVIYKNLGQKIQALADIAKAVDLTSRLSITYGNYLYVFYDDQDPGFPVLIADLTTAIEYYPDQAYLYRIRGYIYERMEQYEAAIADYQQAIELEPGHLEAYCGLGNSYLHMGSYDLAVAALEIGAKSEVNVPRNHRWCTARLEEARVLAATPAP